MIHFTPTLGIRDTSKNARNFIKENKSEFWSLIKSLAPYLLIVLALTAYVQSLALKEMSGITETLKDIKIENPDTSTTAEEQITNTANNIQKDIKNNPEFLSTIKKYEYLGYGLQLLVNYLFAAIAITWHRIVIHGRQKYTPMNIFKPRKSELHYLALIILTMFAAPFFLEIIANSSQENANLGLLAAILAIAYLYIAYKICFLFPARAINASVSVADSFKLTKGYFWKLVLAYILACLPTFFFMLLFIVGTTITIMPIVAAFFADSFLIGAILGYTFIALPIGLYFAPILTIIGVTVLSNYYQHALQNKGLPGAKSAADD